MDLLQVRIIKDLLNNKEIYLDACKKQKNYDIIKETYEELTKAFKSYHINLLQEGMVRDLYIRELKKIKLDPYIAGGLANGAAGIGAGLYSAVSTAENNANIDYNRNALNQSLNNLSNVTSSLERNLLNILVKLYDLLNENERIKVTMEKTSENIYKCCKNEMNAIFDYQKMRRISEDFLSLGDYKDAKILALKCYDEIKKCKRNLRLAATFAFSLFIALVSGVPIVFLIAIPVAYINTLIYIK